MCVKEVKKEFWDTMFQSKFQLPGRKNLESQTLPKIDPNTGRAITILGAIFRTAHAWGTLSNPRTQCNASKW